MIKRSFFLLLYSYCYFAAYPNTYPPIIIQQISTRPRFYILNLPKSTTPVPAAPTAIIKSLGPTVILRMTKSPSLFYPNQVPDRKLSQKEIQALLKHYNEAINKLIIKLLTYSTTRPPISQSSNGVTNSQGGTATGPMTTATTTITTTTTQTTTQSTTTASTTETTTSSTTEVTTTESTTLETEPMTEPTTETTMETTLETEPMTNPSESDPPYVPPEYEVDPPQLPVLVSRRRRPRFG